MQLPWTNLFFKNLSLCEDFLQQKVQKLCLFWVVLWVSLIKNSAKNSTSLPFQFYVSQILKNNISCLKMDIRKYESQHQSIEYLIIKISASKKVENISKIEKQSVMCDVKKIRLNGRMKGDVGKETPKKEMTFYDVTHDILGFLRKYTYF